MRRSEAGDAAAVLDLEDPWAPARFGSEQGEAGATDVVVAADGSGGFVLLPKEQAQGAVLARASWADSLADVGWSGLSVSTTDVDAADGAKMYAAGLAEGFLSWRRIREFKHNSGRLVEMNSDNADKLPQLRAALAATLKELSGPSKSFDSDGSAFQRQAHLALLQAWGVRDGYNLGSQGIEPLSMVDMFILNSDGVIDELISKYGGGASNAESDMSFAQRRSSHTLLRGNSSAPRTRRRPTGHCTGFARLTEDRSELYFGHTTWESFSEMTRIWKVYDFPLQDVAAKRISFSSYPGCVSSTDDYYLMDSGLAITETTLSVPQEQTYPRRQIVPDFIRIMAANRLSSSAEDWAQSMVDSATGTYSSQWMIVDYKKFSPGGDLTPGTFVVLEQAPGISHFEDMSSWLQKEGYWASFDRAFFDDIRARTGDEAVRSRSQQDDNLVQAELYSKDHTPRAQIAKRTASQVNSLSAMRDEMSANHGTQEPVDLPALQNPRYAFSARDDMTDATHRNRDGSPDGGVDAKITSRCLFQTLSAQAISGPAHGNLPAFHWTSTDGSETWPGNPHEGLPDVADFPWVSASPAVGGSPLQPLNPGACQ